MNSLANPLSRILWQIPSHAPFGTLLPLRPWSGFPPFSLSPLGLAKRVADVRSPERACRSEPELVSEAAKRAGASLGGRSTTTYRTIDARLPSDCERLLFINSPRLFLPFFPKNAFGGALLACGHFSTTPFLSSGFFDFFIPASTPPVRSVFHHPRPFIFSLQFFPPRALAQIL